jgi:hypothetical protein
MANVHKAITNAREQLEAPTQPIPGQMIQAFDGKIGAVLDALSALATEFAEFRTSVTAEIEELKDRLTERS